MKLNLTRKIYGTKSCWLSHHLSLIHMPWHVFQENLFHDLTGHWGEADWPVVCRVLLFKLFKNGCDVSLFQPLGTSHHCHDFLNKMENSLANTSSNIVKHIEHFVKWFYNINISSLMLLFPPHFFPCSSIRPFYRLQFFKNQSSMGPFHRV